jgi:hypothetical protein
MADIVRHVNLRRHRRCRRAHRREKARPAAAARAPAVVLVVLVALLLPGTAGRETRPAQHYTKTLVISFVTVLPSKIELKKRLV